MNKTIIYCVLSFVFIALQNTEAQEGTLRKKPRVLIQTMNEEEEVEVIQFFKPIIPLKIQRTEQLKANDPDKYQSNIVNLIKNKKQLDQLKSNNPSEYEERINTLKRENSIDELVKQYRNSTDSQERKSIAAQLNPLLEKQFEVREAKRIQQIKKMEENLQELKQTLEARKKNKKEIIQNYFDKITTKGDSLEW